MHAPNRLAVHQSLVHPRDVLELTEALPGTGWHSVGLHVGGAQEVEPWWHGGAGERNLARLVALLLETRVTVLDVGRVHLGSALPRDDVHADHGRVLDLGARFGARYVTARLTASSPAERADVFGQLAEQARPYRVLPLLAPVPADRPDLVDDAVAVVAPSGGGVVLDVPVGSCTPAGVEAVVDALGEFLGYVRLSARQVAAAGDDAAGLLATLPPHVPVALGGDDSAGFVTGDVHARLGDLHGRVDALLEHRGPAPGGWQPDEAVGAPIVGAPRI
ncbi:hypothetical protein GCM10027451_36900 [Geodermatophilus aquaeductus]|uniref:Uncharacterized protein n=1 Tax=Geodermatophilus aquaeductus TaxID=1564161 RepID=A0A521FIL3_9ACTN|nr:hypothetical protein [Geodermatophilus aquaeductus]SMO96047.1 hypothetical protein SAMN06273567_109109 [Geodermatophilus aquaeductus]